MCVRFVCLHQAAGAIASPGRANYAGPFPWPPRHGSPPPKRPGACASAAQHVPHRLLVAVALRGKGMYAQPAQTVHGYGSDQVLLLLLLLLLSLLFYSILFYSILFPLLLLLPLPLLLPLLLQARSVHATDAAAKVGTLLSGWPDPSFTILDVQALPVTTTINYYNNKTKPKQKPKLTYKNKKQKNNTSTKPKQS